MLTDGAPVVEQGSGGQLSQDLHGDSSMVGQKIQIHSLVA